MKKKFILMLPCVVSVAFAALVSMKTFESNALGTDTLLAQDVEALSQGDSGSFFVPCYRSSVQCSYNAIDANGQAITIIVDKMVKAAPYK